MGIFDLEPCLKDRIFVESKASKYFDLDWSSEKFSRFTLGKNNSLDDTHSFTSNLCESICSFYSAQGPEDWNGLDGDQQVQVVQFEERPFSFKKKKASEESYLRSIPIVSPVRESKLPFNVPVKNNKVVLNEDMKKQI